MVPICSSKRANSSTIWSSMSLMKILILFISAAAIVVSSHNIYRARMVRLCIASVDPAKLSSQCVMCNRREFPLTVIDCTGISKMNDLIASPLSVQDATCLIYNCRRQVPDIKPEPYHGTAAVRANYPSASGIRSYEMMAPPSMYGVGGGGGGGSGGGGGGGGGYGGVGSHSMLRYSNYGMMPYGASSSMMLDRQQQLPYAIIPANYASPFGR